MRLSIPFVVLAASALSACSCASPSPDHEAGEADGSLADGGRDGGRDGGTDAGADAGRDGGLDAGHDAAPFDAGPPCEVPVVWPADTTTEATATTAVTALSSTAMPTWNDARGTFESVYQLNLPLDCPDGSELWSAILPLVTAHPEIFQIDLVEWRTPSSYPCAVVSSSIDFARLDRVDLGPGTVAHDFVSFVVVRAASGGVELRAFIGNYLPPVPDAVAAEMARCGGLAVDRARASALSATFPYSTFDRCIPSGGGVYHPGPLDVVALDPPQWSWSERTDGTGVELTSAQPGTLTIDPSYVTPMLEASDTNCPNAADTARVYGFRVIFDAQTGEILSKLPGIGCIVC